jgi:hypothetical protein
MIIGKGHSRMRDPLKRIQVALALAAIAVAMSAGGLPHHHDGSESDDDSCALCILGQHSPGEHAASHVAGLSLTETARFNIVDSIVHIAPPAAAIEARGPPLT